MTTFLIVAGVLLVLFYALKIGWKVGKWFDPDGAVILPPSMPAAPQQTPPRP